MPLNPACTAVSSCVICVSAVRFISVMVPSKDVLRPSSIGCVPSDVPAIASFIASSVAVPRPAADTSANAAPLSIPEATAAGICIP